MLDSIFSAMAILDLKAAFAVSYCVCVPWGTIEAIEMPISISRLLNRDTSYGDGRGGFIRVFEYQHGLNLE